MRFVKLTRANHKEFVRVMRKIFSRKADRESAECCYKANIDGTFWWNPVFIYWLVYDGRKPIGLSGIYDFKGRPKEMWMGWFGVLPNVRHKGIGTKILNKTIAAAKRRGAKRFRVFVTGIKAFGFYEKNGFHRFRYKKREVFDGKAVWCYEPKTVFYEKKI